MLLVAGWEVALLQSSAEKVVHGNRGHLLKDRFVGRDGLQQLHRPGPLPAAVAGLRKVVPVLAAEWVASDRVKVPGEVARGGVRPKAKLLHRPHSSSLGRKPRQGADLVGSKGARVLQVDQELVELFSSRSLAEGVKEGCRVGASRTRGHDDP